MSDKLPLLSIPEPCSADWNKMHGDEKKRFCGLCKKHVHSLEAYRPSEVNELFEREPDACVRVIPLPDKRFVTKRRMDFSVLGSAFIAMLAIAFSGCKDKAHIDDDDVGHKYESSTGIHSLGEPVFIAPPEHVQHQNDMSSIDDGAKETACDDDNESDSRVMIKKNAPPRRTMGRRVPTTKSTNTSGVKKSAQHE